MVFVWRYCVMILGVHGIIASGGGVSFDADYQAILDYATTQGYTLPSASQQTLQNQLVVDLKAAGVWSKLDTFAVFATDGDADFALIDWINLSQYTAYNSPTFTSNQGFQGNGTSSYIGSNHLTLTDAISLSQDSNSHGYMISIYDSSPSTAEQHWGNAINSSAQGFWRRVNNINNYHNATSSFFLSKTYPTGQLIHMDRPDSSNVYNFVNGAVESSASVTSASPLDQEFISLRYSGNYSDAEIQIVFAGGSLYSEANDFNTAVKTYINSL